MTKGAGKDNYTLRFATDDKAQEWRRAFELMAKVNSALVLFTKSISALAHVSSLVAAARSGGYAEN